MLALNGAWDEELVWSKALTGIFQGPGRLAAYICMHACRLSSDAMQRDLPLCM